MTSKTRMTVLGALLAAGLGLAAAAGAQEVVKIGYSGPLSGGAALYGKSVLEGMQMAADEVNAAGFEVGGKKYKIEIVALDDKYNPSETAINAQRLVQEHRTPAILVPHSGGTYALQTTNEQQKYLVLSYTSVPLVTSRGNKLTVRVAPEYTGYLLPYVKYSMAKYGKNVALAAADHDYAKAWAAAFKLAWEGAGGKVVAENPMSYNKSADFYSGVSRALAAKPDVLFIGGPSEPTALVVKQARELGFKGGFAILDQARIDEMARIVGGYGPMEGAIGVLPIQEIKTPGVSGFSERFQKAHQGRVPLWEHVLNYSAVRLTAEAMKLAGSVSDAVAIRAQMDKSARSLSAAANPLAIDGIAEQGGISMSAQIGVVEGDRVTARTARDFK
jgi:branched-chain amino acid transport system substrate-binding protein